MRPLYIYTLCSHLKIRITKLSSPGHQGKLCDGCGGREGLLLSQQLPGMRGTFILQAAQRGLWEGAGRGRGGGRPGAFGGGGREGGGKRGSRGRRGHSGGRNFTALLGNR